MNNPPAFPGKQKALLIKSEHSDIAKQYEIDQNGMTLRDYFAATALNTILSQYDFTFFEDDKRVKDGDTFALVVAKNAYEMADAMLKAREA